MRFLPTAAISEETFFSSPLPAVAVLRRAITDGDERGFLAVEAAAFASGSDLARRQSGAARIAARDLFRRRFARENAAILRAPDRSPIWPQGFVGSLAHDETTAVAAIARSRDFAALGIDIEPSQPLGAELVDLVATPAELQRYAPAIVESRLLFVIKEAVYKALYPLDRRVLEFHEIEVDLEAAQAWTADRRAAILFCLATQVAALAYPV